MFTIWIYHAHMDSTDLNLENGSAQSPHLLYQYLPHSLDDEQWGLTLTGSGHQEIQAGEAYPPPHPNLYTFSWKRGRILSEVQLVYILSGEGEFETKESRHLVKAGHALLIVPGQWHRYRPKLKTGWQEYWLGLQGSQITHWLQNGCLPSRGALLHIGIQKQIIDHFQHIQALIQERPPGVQPTVAHLASSIITSALSLHRQHELKPSGPMVRQAIERMHQQVEGDLNLQALASQLGSSYDAFRRAFKKSTDLSPRQYYLQIKIQRAQELLRCTKMSVADISQQLHFDTSFYFSRLFKEKVGQSPQYWRKGKS